MLDIDSLEVTSPHEAGQTSPSADDAPIQFPQRIGRYQVEKLLGKGGFGLVYLAHDVQLSRPVAIKVPHANLLSSPKDAVLYRTEARTVADLDHPTIVPAGGSRSKGRAVHLGFGEPKRFGFDKDELRKWDCELHHVVRLPNQPTVRSAGDSTIPG
jgi:hypothetical protein